MAHVRYIYPFCRVVIRKHQYNREQTNRGIFRLLILLYSFDLIVKGQSQSLTSSFINTQLYILVNIAFCQSVHFHIKFIQMPLLVNSFYTQLVVVSTFTQNTFLSIKLCVVSFDTFVFILSYFSNDVVSYPISGNINFQQRIGAISSSSSRYHSYIT